MSLHVHEIRLGEQVVTLRLTSKALMNFNLKHGVEGNSPAVAVLGAVSDYAARIDLFTNALNHPENKNTVKQGDQLLDLLTDHSWDRDTVNQLILDLAEESGLLKSGEVVDLMNSVTENGSRMIQTLGSLLRGENPGDDARAEEPEGTEEENPT